MPLNWSCQHWASVDPHRPSVSKRARPQVLYGKQMRIRARNCVFIDAFPAPTPRSPRRPAHADASLALDPAAWGASAPLPPLPPCYSALAFAQIRFRKTEHGRSRNFDSMFSPSGPSRNDGQHPCKTGPPSVSHLGMGGGARLKAMRAARPSQGLRFKPCAQVVRARGGQVYDRQPGPRNSRPG